MENYKIGIIGGGAAGLMSAISAAEAGCKSAAVFEGNIRCGTKILMSGGTRCNVTNRLVRPEHFFGGSRNFIKNVLSAFSDKAAIEFFEGLGVKLKQEPTGKYFPADDDANSVLSALINRIKGMDVSIYNSTKISDIDYQDGVFILKSGKQEFTAGRVIITTGGKSYPSTGSDGTGYSLAEKLGHSIITPLPALTPILLDEPELKSLSGITINAKLSIIQNNKKHIEIENSLLLTHVGISGPAALNISREVERLKNEDIKLVINFLPLFTYDSLLEDFRYYLSRNPDKTIINYFREKLPDNLCTVLFRLAGVDVSKKPYSISKDEIKKLSTTFTNYNLKFTGVKGFQQAEVTAGGVPLEEIKYQTMESKIRKGLYFAGEILDVDGIIGGYNFQWAWSSGFIAGRAAAL
jgi:predicted Rossmann fold flavoprotein